MKLKRYTALVLLFCFDLGLTFSQERPLVSSDFAGGNILVVKTDGDTLWLKPDLSGTEGEWFYWHFRISNMAGTKLYFRFTLDDQFTVFGPAYSINNDHSWKWYGENRVQDNGFSFTFSPEDTVAWFCTAFPYTAEDLDRFLGRLRNPERVVRDTLCLTKGGRPVEQLFLLPSGDNPLGKVLITARHHACEMMASYVLEGIIESILNEVDLEYLRENVEFRILPVMDWDGVENGDQGKNRMPRDHNRDYSGVSIYPATGALREQIPRWSDGRLRVALDLHCPWIKGNYHEVIHMVGGEDSGMVQQQLRFGELLQKHATGELRFRNSDFLPFGTDWNTGNNYARGMGFSQWAGELENISLATTLEFPYASILGVQVSKDNARAFGKAVSYALRDYLRGINEPGPVQNGMRDWRAVWPEPFQEVEIPSSLDATVQKAMFLPARGNEPQPLIVSLHTWSGDYRQEDPLAPMVFEKGWNYVHPDFRGSNTSPEACGSEKVIPDIEDAIRYAMEHGNIDPENIHVAGTSGGGYATLLMYMNSSMDIRSFSAWVPISDLVDWYWETRSRGLKYAGDILKCTGSRDSVLNVEEAKKRSPFFMDTPASRWKSSTLDIYCGIHDGYTGSVPITQSIRFYNKLVTDMKGEKAALVPAEDIIHLLARRIHLPPEPSPLTGPEGRRVHYRKQFRSVSLTIFEGGHEMLPETAMENLIRKKK